MTPDETAGVLRNALAGHTGDTTIADAAARGGLALRDAELGLHRLLAIHRGHLSVTDKGELLFRFPGGFAIDWERRGRLQTAARAVGRALAGLGKWTVRVGLALFLVGYGAVFAVGLLIGAIALSVVAEDIAPLETFGYVVWGVMELMYDALFWSTHPLTPIDDGSSERHSRAFHARVNRFFFGPPQAPEDPRALTRTLAGEIRARRGRIGIGDVVRVTGLPRAEAEAAVSRLLVDYDGHVDVTDEGAIVYRFAELLPTAAQRALATPATAAPAIWRDPVRVPAFTGNTTGSNVSIVLLCAFVAAIAAVGVLLGLPLWVAELPLFATLAFMAVPLVRAPFHRARVRRLARENGRRALLQAAHESAVEARGVDESELAAAWAAAAGRPIAHARLQRMLVEMGGDVVVDANGRWAWRFPDLELELRALAAVRAEADDRERDPGSIDFSSMTADD